MLCGVICFTSEICACIYHLEWHEKIHRNLEQISNGLFSYMLTTMYERKRKLPKQGTERCHY